MATTKSRKLRRLPLHARKEMIREFLSAYIENPRQALETMFQYYGRKRFELILQLYLKRHSIKHSLVLAVERCTKEAA